MILTNYVGTIVTPNNINLEVASEQLRFYLILFS